MAQAANLTIFVPEVFTDSKFAVTGADSQVLSVSLKPGEKVVSEPSAMLMMSPKVKTDVEFNSCSRCLTGEGCCKVVFENQGNSDGFVSLTPKFPAKVVPINLQQVGGKFIAKKGAFMSSIDDVEVGLKFDCGITGCCGTLGCCLQQSTGSGTAFYAAGGTILQKTLAPGERIIVDSNSIVGFQESVSYGITFAGGCCGICFGGEGCFNGTLTGPGQVMLQSMSFQKYMHAAVPLQDGQQGGSSASGSG